MSIFLDLADTKKEVYDIDVFHLIKRIGKTQDFAYPSSPIIELFSYVKHQVIATSPRTKMEVSLLKDKEHLTGIGEGTCIVEALFHALRNTVPIPCRISRGDTALGRGRLQLEHRTQYYSSKAIDTDIFVAISLAYINGVN